MRVRNSALFLYFVGMLCLHKVYIDNPVPRDSRSVRWLNGKFRERGYGSVYLLPSKIPVPCGDCVFCRLHHTAEVIARLICESYSHGWVAYFVTLTIEGNNVFDVSRKDVEKLTSAMRAHNRHFGTNYKYYITSEYGSRSDRPHYHAILYGFDGQFACREFVEKYYTKGLVSVEVANMARFRYTANAHVNKCSHVPYKPVIDFDGEKYLLPCEKPFITCSQKLGLDYVLLNARNILRDGFIRLDGIPFPVSRTLMDYLYRSVGLSPVIERLSRFANPSAFDSLEAYRRIARKFNYDDTGADFRQWYLDFMRYLKVAEQAQLKSYNDKFVSKYTSYSV